jgi:hypothetical protein
VESASTVTQGTAKRRGQVEDSIYWDSSKNVAALVRPPKGQHSGRPSITLEQAIALMDAAQGTRLEAYIILCLLAGVRTEEARAWPPRERDAYSPLGRMGRMGRPDEIANAVSWLLSPEASLSPAGTSPSPAGSDRPAALTVMSAGVASGWAD